MTEAFFPSSRKREVSLFLSLFISQVLLKLIYDMIISIGDQSVRSPKRTDWDRLQFRFTVRRRISTANWQEFLIKQCRWLLHEYNNYKYSLRVSNYIKSKRNYQLILFFKRISTRLTFMTWLCEARGEKMQKRALTETYRITKKTMANALSMVCSLK